MKEIKPKRHYIGLDLIEIEQLRTLPNYYAWDNICYCYDLSEDFFLEFKDWIYWEIVSQKQILSDQFIMSNLDKLDIEALLVNNYISEQTKNYIRMFI